MAAEGGLNLQEIIEFLKLSRNTGEPILYTDWAEVKLENNYGLAWRQDDFECELHWQKVKLYEVDALQFLSFSKQDVEEDSEKGRVNALSNAKRAIECRMDEFLKLSNLEVFSSRHKWNLPYKIMVLRTFGVPTPDILKRLINTKRRLLEHRYEIPKERQEIQDAVELAELFLEASRQYVERGYIASAIVSSTSWFKPGALAPTWFGRGIGATSRKYEYHDGFSDQYKLEFDLNEVITLSYSNKEVYGRCDLKTGEKMVKEDEYKDKQRGPLNIPIRECKIEEVTELMKLLTERGEERREKI